MDSYKYTNELLDILKKLEKIFTVVCKYYDNDCQKCEFCYVDEDDGTVHKFCDNYGGLEALEVLCYWVQDREEEELKGGNE